VVLSRAPPQRSIGAVPRPLTPLKEILMFDTPQTPRGEVRRYDQEIRHCEHSILWSHWALGLGVGAAAGPASQFAALLRRDPRYARTMVEVYKMMLIEQAGSSVRDRIAAIALDRIHRALDAYGLIPVVDPLNMAIDYSVIPLACGIRTEEINALRPNRLTVGFAL